MAAGGSTLGPASVAEEADGAVGGASDLLQPNGKKVNNRR
jgi:hypothetical protein